MSQYALARFVGTPQATVESINTKHINARYLPRHTLPDNVRATNDAKEAIVGADYIVHAVPVQHSFKFLNVRRPTRPLC